MTSLQHSLARPFLRWTVLVAVGVLGLLVTFWADSKLAAIERERLGYRFEQTAHAHAEALIEQMRQPLAYLETLQRLFASVAEIDRASFARFTEPMLELTGARSYSWLPRVRSAERAGFEQKGRLLWGEQFAIEDVDGEGMRIPAAERERYFPLLYSVPDEIGRRYVGYNVTSNVSREPLIEHAIENNLAVASEIGPLVMDHRQKDVLLLIMPVYEHGLVPATPSERQAKVSGIVVAALNVVKLFDTANERVPDSGFNARLMDFRQVSDRQRIGEWTTRLTGDSGSANAPVLTYAENFNLASHVWTVQVEASPVWVELNQAQNLRLVWPFGLLLTLLLVLYLRYLLRRSALADTLVLAHESSLIKQQATENWASKLLMAIEQSPITIYITDLDGRIEYVNPAFLETTGYLLEEIIGQYTHVLRPVAHDESVYAELWATISAGQSWRGDVQTRRRDGTLCWERLRISPIRDNGGRLTKFLAIKENISEVREVMSRLQDSENRFLGAMSVMVEGFAMLSPDGTYLFANQKFNDFFECASQGILGLRPADISLERLREDGSICPPEEYPANLTLTTGREVRGQVLGFRYADGRLRWAQINTSALPVEGDARNGVVLTFSDITERRAAEEQLKLASEAIRQSGEGVLITDAGQRIISVNPAFEAMTGYSADEMVGKIPADFASGRHDDAFFKAMNEALEVSGHWQGEVWNTRKNGEIFPEWLGVSVVRDYEGKPKSFIYIFSDMTERKEIQQRIEFLAHHDALTGLPNRLLLRDRMEHAQAKANRMRNRIAMIFLDLDRFKTINDSLGHPVGDALLRQVVERLKSCVRESDTISRQGGDEFIILLDEVRDSDSVSRIADKIHMRMAEPVILEGHSLMTSFSMGIAIYPDDGEDFDTLMQKADTAMYHAKAAGRNSHRFFTEQMNLQVVEHLTLETQLRRALENNEFVLHYQPQLSLHDGRIVGVEALIRWNNPESGLVPPGKFIPVAEDSGLIVRIGAWVLGEACRQAAAWQKAGLQPFVVAVNLSAVQFRRPDLVNNVINALVLSDLDSEWLELELTESILIQDAEMTLDAVRRLKALGVKLSVDDFGTGYSSLTYLKRFAVDKLKIDQTFVRDLMTDPDDAAIVRAIIEMAHSLKLKTIAEGVESEELSNLLRIFNCDEIQGYWFARPMPADELEAFVRTHQEGKD